MTWASVHSHRFWCFVGSGKYRWQDHQVAESWFGTGWSPWLSLAVPLWCSGDVHARRLRHVGDGKLPRQERIQRSHEEFGECLRWNLGLVEHRLGTGLWRTTWQWFHWNRRLLWLRLLHARQGQWSDHTCRMHCWWLSFDYVKLVLPMGVLYCRCHHCERGSSRACQEPHLCCLCVLDDKLHLSHGCGIHLGWWLVGLTFRRRLHGLLGW